MLTSFRLTLLFFVGLALSPSALFAGGIKGNMFNLPRGADLDPISVNETIEIRVTQFNANEAIDILDAKGKPFPAERIGADNRVQFTGPTFAFTLPKSPVTKNRQAVTVQFFRKDAPDTAGLETQRIVAIIVADTPDAFNAIDVSVPRPTEMGMHVQTNTCPDCVRRGLLRRIFRH